MAAVAAMRAVASPTQASRSSTQPSAAANSGLTRTSRYTPAVTIVAAWMRADTGVGPAIASGSHTYSGNCADLPAAPSISKSTMAEAVVEVTTEVSAKMPV